MSVTNQNEAGEFPRRLLRRFLQGRRDARVSRHRIIVARIDRGLRYEFVREYRAEYAPAQLDGFDVLISLKPKITAASLEGIVAPLRDRALRGWV